MTNIIAERKNKLKREITVANQLLMNNLSTVGSSSNSSLHNQTLSSHDGIGPDEIIDSLDWLSKSFLSHDNKLRKGISYLKYGLKISNAFR